MCRPAKWLQGLIPLFLLFLGALGIKAPEIREQLTQRTERALTSQGGAGLDSAVSVSGRDVSLSGLAFNVGSFEAAAATAYAVHGVRTVHNGLTLPPEASAYLFSAERNGATVILTGLAPDPTTRAQITAAAKALGGSVEDRLDYARGAPSAYLAMTKAALAPLSYLQKGSSGVKDGALFVQGVTRDSEGYFAALTAIKALPQEIKRGKIDIQAPAQSPYLWSAANDGKTLTLSGAVASEDVRKSLIDAVRKTFPDLAIVNSMFLAGGSPVGFVQAAGAGLEALGGLRSGVVSLSDMALSIKGVVKDGVSSNALSRKLSAALPKPGAVAAFNVQYPVQTPYTFGAAKSDDGKYTLSGFAPSEGDIKTLLSLGAAAGATPQGSVKLASGLSPSVDFGAVSKLGMKILALLQSGQITIDDRGLSVSGSGTSANLAEIRALLSAGGVKLGVMALQSSGPVPAPSEAAPAAAPPIPRRQLNDAEAVCQRKMSDHLTSNKIQFATGSSRIHPDSAGVLKTLVGLLKECADVSVLIAGFTDNVGDSDSNRELSLKRAHAVERALADDGVAESRMEARGYGADNPIASNDADEGRAQNRRIEFIVK